MNEVFITESAIRKLFQEMFLKEEDVVTSNNQTGNDNNEKLKNAQKLNPQKAANALANTWEDMAPMEKGAAIVVASNTTNAMQNLGTQQSLVAMNKIDNILGRLADSFDRNLPPEKYLHLYATSFVVDNLSENSNQEDIELMRWTLKNKPSLIYKDNSFRNYLRETLTKEIEND